MSIDGLGRLIVWGGPWILVLARTLGLSTTAPAWSTSGLDARSRLILAVVLAGLIAPVVVAGLTAPPDLWMLGQALLGELVIGAGLGWSAGLVIAGARQAGEVVGAQAGLSPAALFDPEAGDGITPMGHLYGMMALGVFLAMDGPTQLVFALAESYQVIPVLNPTSSVDVVNWAFGQLGQAMVLTLRAAAPPALALTIAGLAMGLLGRAAPSLSLVALSLPVRTLLGLTLAMIGLVTLGLTLEAAWRLGFPWGL